MQLVTLGSVADIVEINGPVQINHRERMRAVTHPGINPEEDRPLESAMELVEQDILAPMREEGRSRGAVQGPSLGRRGQAHADRQVALQWNLMLALTSSPTC